MAKVKIGNVFPPLAWLMERCAPAGYGLGSVGGYDTWNGDANALTKQGWYRLESGTTNGVGSSASLRVDGYTETGLTQTAYTRTGFIVQRACVDGLWSEWEWENPPMLAGMEYRITERWNGKPVYTALVDCGACVSPSMEIATELTCGQIIRHCGTVSAHSMPSINATLDNAWSVWAMVTNSDGRVKITVYSGTGMATEHAYVQVWYTKS